ncbi:hypothetical protein LNQ81_11495 [Myroides sp. M-43]|uniref:AAA family ATPase n=1 Tax=Myroides oncorhynchi TaxID=2893756 RepID=UPI001E394964|nr:hypothetical protein [Myroides oncorhynchi]MCC9043295.1 hypothetical protein [Myroides oncorhynchi]
MDIQKNITEWLMGLKGWQTELAYRILTKNIEEYDLIEIIGMVKSEIKFDIKSFPNFINIENEKLVRLLSIESIQNIERLAPRNPLKFEQDKNLVVIYGSNGSGKSGYTKILKKISGKARTVNLKSNVFAPNTEGKCKVKFSIDDIEQEYEWLINSEPIKGLGTIDVFDTNIGNSYINEANTITYTPNFLRLFTALSHYYSKVQEKINSEKLSLLKTLPNIPNEYLNTLSGTQYNNLKKDDNDKKLESIIIWNEEKEKNRLDLEKRLKEQDPLKSAEEVRNQKNEIDKIIKEVVEAYSQVSVNSITQIKELEANALQKRKIAKESIQIISNESNIKGVGSSVWKSLWEAARVFSYQEAYENDTYPNINDEAKCVLCHQILDSNTKNRLLAFENFVKSELESDATIAEKLYLEKINNLPTSLHKDLLMTKCSAAKLGEVWLNCLITIWKIIGEASNSIKNKKEYIVDVKFIQDNLKILEEMSTSCEASIQQLQFDAQQFDRVKAINQLLELNTQKWCSMQKDSILGEVERLRKLSNYEIWIAQCNTKSITSKSSELSEIFITDEYVKRFNKELDYFQATRIRVELLKEKAVKGTITHSLRLKGISGHKLAEVLSEGEHRIIALASFLADVTGGNNNNPFVFDDPISSLDQQFEEKTVERLVLLSQTRQVIIFTHRLSLLGLLNDKSDSNNIQIIGIRNETWGAGEVGDTPLFAKKTITALNNIKNERIAKAKKILNDQGSEEYYPFGKALCSDIRILIERIVELDFLADVVQRYRRSVNTMGKVQNLAKIQQEDCEMIDNYMTKYSCYEHSQPSETPIEIPDPAELELDVDKLLHWLKEFNSRKVN